MIEVMRVAGMAFIALGLGFDLLGCVGLVRLPDIYNRLQAATKCVTLGTCSILFGVFLMSGLTGVGIKCLLCAGFVVLTAPVSAHAIARGAHKAGIALCDESVVDHYAEDTGDTAAAIAIRGGIETHEEAWERAELKRGEHEVPEDTRVG